MRTGDAAAHLTPCRLCPPPFGGMTRKHNLFTFDKSANYPKVV